MTMPNKPSPHPNFREEVPIQDEHFAGLLNTIADRLPEGWQVFSAMTQNGLHAMGCERKDSGAQSTPTLVQIPGHCHKSSAFRKTWLPHALDGIQTIALTPPGTSPSKRIDRPIVEWGVSDYLEPIREATREIAGKRDFLVMEGHSLGGLLALLVAARAREIESLRTKIRAWIGINSIKPPNIAQRLEPFEFPDKSDEMSFEKHPEFFLEWVNGLFDTPTEEKIKKFWGQAEPDRLEAMRARLEKLPKDFQWIVEDRKTCRGPRNIVNDYGYGVWAIRPNQVTVPLLDINGALDREEISGVRKETKTDKIREPAQMFADNSNIRRCIAKYYALGEINLAENERVLEDRMGMFTGVQEYPEQIWGWQAILREGTHNSPIELEGHVEIARLIIRDFLIKVKNQPHSTDHFTLFYK
jgi:pimeloyl-ACP methyl ester carboxylesterase